MKKKSIGIMLVATTLSVALSACGGSQNAASEGMTQQEETVASPAERKDDSDDIFVQKIDGLSTDFIRGMDASSVLVEENSGVKYYDFEGNECDVFKTLSYECCR